MFLLYHGPLFNQSRWLLSVFISYYISLLDLIIHDIPTWWNIAFNTSLVTISSYNQVKLVSKSKPVSLLQLIHFIDKASKSSSQKIKRISNMEDIFNNDDIRPWFSCILFALCPMMARKGNHCILFLLMLASVFHYQHN